MADQNGNKPADLELKGDGVQAGAGLTDSSAALVKEALSDMMRNKTSTTGSDGSQNAPQEKKSGASDNSNGPSDKDKTHPGDNRMPERPEDMIGIIRDPNWERLFRPLSDGAIKLNTGDTLVKDGDREILFMPNGDKLAVNKDGSFDLKSKGPVEIHKVGDTTTLLYPNGDKVSFDKDGIKLVSRGDKTTVIHEFPVIRPPVLPIYPGPYNQKSVQQ